MCDKVRVAVRVRPLNRREQDLGTHSVVDIQDNRTILNAPSAKETRWEEKVGIRLLSNTIFYEV